MRKIFLLFLLTLMLIPFVNAVQPQVTFTPNTGLVVDYPKFDTMQVNNSFNLTLDVYNISDGLQVSNANCSIQIYNSSGQLKLNSPLNYIPTVGYNYFIDAGNLSVVSTHSFRVYCNNSVGGFTSGLFELTNSGEAPGGDVLASFIYLLFMLSFVGLIYCSIISLFHMAAQSQKIYDVALAWGSFIFNLFVYYLAQQYIIDSLIARISLLLLGSLWVTTIVLPTIAYVFSFIKRRFAQKNGDDVYEEWGGPR